MKTSKKFTSRVARMKNTLIGRLVCRVMGEESGQAMLEYVIIATVVAAAVAFGFWMFGSQVRDGLIVIGKAVKGLHIEARQDTENNQKNEPKESTLVIKHGDAFSSDSNSKSKK